MKNAANTITTSYFVVHNKKYDTLKIALMTTLQNGKQAWDIKNREGVCEGEKSGKILFRQSYYNEATKIRPL